MLVILAGFLVFSAISAEKTGREDVVYPSLETSRIGIKTLKFRALDQDISLKLQSAAHIIADDFVFMDGKGNNLMKNDSIKALKSRIYKDSENGAALIIDEDGPLSIKGIVNSSLRIEPIESEEKIKDGVRAHRIIEVKTNDRPGIGFNDDIVIPPRIKDEVTKVKNSSKSES